MLCMLFEFADNSFKKKVRTKTVKATADVKEAVKEVTDVNLPQVSGQRIKRTCS